MTVPLFEDLRTDGKRLNRRLAKVTLFAGLLFALDFAIWFPLSRGLEHYFGLDEAAEILLIGHSHTVLAVDKAGLSELTGKRVAKYAREGASMADREVMIRQYLDRHPGAVRLVVMDVDAHIFTSSGLSQNSYRFFLPFMADPVVNEYLATQDIFWLDRLVRRVLRSSRFDETTLNISMRGLTNNWSSYKNGRVDLARIKTQVADGDFLRITFDVEAAQSFDRIRVMLRERGVGLVLVYYPTIDVLNRAEPERFAEVMALLRGFADEGQGVWFLDYNTRYELRHELFYDPVHMNVQGQQEITSVLSRDLKQLLESKRQQSVAMGHRG